MSGRGVCVSQNCPSIYSLDLKTEKGNDLSKVTLEGSQAWDGGVHRSLD